ncbi:MAG TPA: GNAT family N-acetyltransferase [Nanoarchaeota archaeon]|nr:GNAT family N-acetyltransferase [Nanoarchaeota archaeon]
MANAVLKPLSLEYLNDMLGWVNNRDVTKNFAKFGKRITRQQEIAHINRMTASKTDRAFVMETKEGKYLGNISLHEIDWNAKKARMSILIANREERDRGYGKSAIRRLLKLAFNELGLHKVWLIVFEGNMTARGLYSRCGFQEEGILKDEYFVAGKYHNMVRMAILKGGQ